LITAIGGEEKTVVESGNLKNSVGNSIPKGNEPTIESKKRNGGTKIPKRLAKNLVIGANKIPKGVKNFKESRISKIEMK
jgi:hypothetical protein